MLFVERDAQRHGVARALIAAAFPGKRPGGPVSVHSGTGAGGIITVNATPGSITAYSHLGFRPAGRERESDGLRVLPMTRRRERSGRTSPPR
jgi:GNAT superfamily N-acetyltransferase